jgi:regulatory protein
MMKKFLSPEDIWKKIIRWCDYQDRSHQEARDKLYALGLHKRDVELTISQLISEGFLNEERFAVSFARGKFRMLGWGRIKIRMALQQKKVPDVCIRKALNALPDNDYRSTLQKIIASRLKSAKDIKERYATARYAISRGFEPELVKELLRVED